LTNSPYVRSILAKSAMELMPPMIRESLLENTDFCEEYGFTTDAVLSFGDYGIFIQRSELFNAIRKLLSGLSKVDLVDRDGQILNLSRKSTEENGPLVLLDGNKHNINLSSFVELSPDCATRLSFLDEIALDFYLPDHTKEKWRNIFTERALEDNEVDEFRSDIRNTPVQMAITLRRDIMNGQSGLSTFIPSSRKYYERLVGVYDGSKSIGDYAVGVGKLFFEKLTAWRSYDGFLFSLLLSSNSTITAEIGVECLEDNDLIKVFNFLIEEGDILSQVGAVEIGLRILLEKPEIEPILIRLIKQIRDDNVEESKSGIKLLSSLFIFVDGGLAKSRLFSAEPPFYRRLVSFAQAALICRHLQNSGVDLRSFCDWALGQNLEQYYLQSFVDMRLEPRWNPEFAAASQLKADFFGRIVTAAKIYKNNIPSGELHDIILGSGVRSILTLSEVPYAYFPGPLEGAENFPIALPDELSEGIVDQLNSTEVGPSSFVALVNSALIFRVDSAQAKLAATALKLSRYRLVKVKDKSQLLTVLYGLATVAAVARSHELADELRVLVRRYWQDSHYDISIKEVLQICLVAVASRADLNEWREFAGDWLTEFAFGDLKDDEGEVFYSYLRCLVHSAPELWLTVGKADAALVAYIKK
jgi:hypothetical protein